MGLFTAPKSLEQQADDALESGRATWIVALGSFSGNAVKSAAKVDEAVATIEARGWRLHQLVPSVTGASGGAGYTGTDMVGVFRRS